MGVTTMGSRLASGQQPSAEVKHLAPHLVEAEQTGVISCGDCCTHRVGQRRGCSDPFPRIQTP